MKYTCKCEGINFPEGDTDYKNMSIVSFVLSYRSFNVTIKLLSAVIEFFQLNASYWECLKTYFIVCNALQSFSCRSLVSSRNTNFEVWTCFPYCGNLFGLSWACSHFSVYMYVLKLLCCLYFSATVVLCLLLFLLLWGICFVPWSFRNHWLCYEIGKYFLTKPKDA